MQTLSLPVKRATNVKEHAQTKQAHNGPHDGVIEANLRSDAEPTASASQLVPTLAGLLIVEYCEQRPILLHLRFVCNLSHARRRQESNGACNRLSAMHLEHAFTMKHGVLDIHDTHDRSCYGEPTQKKNAPVQALAGCHRGLKHCRETRHACPTQSTTKPAPDALWCDLSSSSAQFRPPHQR